MSKDKEFANNKEQYAKEFSDSDFQKKVKKSGIGVELLRKAYTLYEVLKSPDTPLWVKGGIIAVLGYFISPVDVIPDVIPVVGYSDDLAVVVGELAAIGSYVTPSITAAVERRIEA